MKFNNMDVVKNISYGFCISLSIGCQPVQLPNNAVLSVSPSTRSIEVTSSVDSSRVQCLAEDFPYLDIPILISLRDDQGSPIGDVPVSVYSDWTSNSTSLTDVVTLLFDFNDDGMVDPEFETVSSSDDGVFEEKTQRSTGDVMLTARLNLSCPYNGEIVAISGGYHAAASFNVRFISDSPEPEPEPEPELRRDEILQRIIR